MADVGRIIIKAEEERGRIEEEVLVIIDNLKSLWRSYLIEK
jgi:hypothetical protein